PEVSLRALIELTQMATSRQSGHRSNRYQSVDLIPKKPDARHTRLAPAIDPATVRRNCARPGHAASRRGAAGALSDRGDADEAGRSGQAVRWRERRVAWRRRHSRQARPDPRRDRIAARTPGCA